MHNVCCPPTAPWCAPWPSTPLLSEKVAHDLPTASSAIRSCHTSPRPAADIMSRSSLAWHRLPHPIGAPTPHLQRSSAFTTLVHAQKNSAGGSCAACTPCSGCTPPARALACELLVSACPCGRYIERSCAPLGHPASALRVQSRNMRT